MTIITVTASPAAALMPTVHVADLSVAFEGKSNACFFITADERFIIKSVTADECHVLRTNLLMNLRV